MSDADAGAGSAAEKLAEVRSLDDELCTWPSKPLLFARANVRDQWPRPITPLTLDLVFGPQERGPALLWSRDLGIMPPPPPWTVSGCFYGWVYTCVDTAAAVAEATPGYSARKAYAQFFGLPPDPSANDEPRSRSGAGEVVRLAGLLLRFARIARRYPRLATRYRRVAGRRLDDASAGALSTIDDRTLVARLEGSAAEGPEWRLPLLIAASVSGPGAETIARLTARLAGDDDGSLARRLLTGIGGIDLAATPRLVEDVAKGRRSVEELVKALRYRGPNEYELSEPTWDDDRAAVERLVAAARARPGASSAETVAATRRSALDEARRRAGIRWPLIAAAMRVFEPHLRWRENAKIHETMHVAYQRALAREAGRRLAERAVVTDADDVFFLRAAEIRADLGGDGERDRRSVVRRRRETHARAATLRLPDLVEAGPGVLAPVTSKRLRALGLVGSDSAPARRDGSVRGLGVSPGTAIGRAHVVEDPFTETLDDGEILVAATTSPAWTPLFAQAAAVVLEHGGHLTHAAMIARELGLPCVVNVANARDVIASGTTIEVNGTTGVVRRVG